MHILQFVGIPLNTYKSPIAMEVSEKPSSRLGYIDMAKGFAMLSVILGHTTLHDAIFFVYIYHMPLFFLVSGFLYNDKAGGLQKRITKLLIPYYFIIVVKVVLLFVVRMIKGQELANPLIILRDYLIASLYCTCENNSYLYPETTTTMGILWFIGALLIATVLLHLVLKLRWLLIQVAIVILMFIFGVATSKCFLLPFAFQTGCTALLFVYIGYLLKPLFYKTNVILYCGSIIVWIGALYVCFHYNLRYDMATINYPFPVTNIIGALCSCYVIIHTFKYIEKQEWLSKPLAFFGKNSMVVFCFHSIDGFAIGPVMDVLKAHMSYLSLEITHFVLRILWACGAIAFVKQFNCLRFIFNIRPKPEGQMSKRIF